MAADMVSNYVIQTLQGQLNHRTQQRDELLQIVRKLSEVHPDIVEKCVNPNGEYYTISEIVEWASE